MASGGGTVRPSGDVQREVPPQEKISIASLGALFLKLGAIGFGGPLAHIALIQEETTEKRRWLTRPEFLEGLALCQALPGPVSTQLAIYAGYRARGYRGAVVSGCCFILPAFALLLVLSWLYFRFGALPALQGLLYGAGPVVLAMILVSGYRLGKEAAQDRLLLAVLAASAALVAAVSINIILLFALAGTLGVLIYGLRTKGGASWPRHLSLVPLPLLVELGWFFLKTGSFIFGGGYVIIPFIEREVVSRLEWMTPKEFLDGLALGQMTPGPVVITATFIGYKVAGLPGAVVATAAIFLPSFVFLFLGIGWLRRVEQSPRVQAALKAVSAAAVGAIVGAVWNLAKVSLGGLFPLALFAVALVAMWKYRISFPKMLATGAALGWLVY